MDEKQRKKAFEEFQSLERRNARKRPPFKDRMVLNEYKWSRCKGFDGTFKPGKRPWPDTKKVEEIADMVERVVTLQDQLDHTRETLFMMGSVCTSTDSEGLRTKVDIKSCQPKSFQIDNSSHLSNEKTNQEIRRTPWQRGRKRWMKINWTSFMANKTNKSGSKMRTKREGAEIYLNKYDFGIV